jgi:hypothetical protein
VVVGAKLTVQGIAEVFGTAAQTQNELEDPTVIGTPATGNPVTAASIDVATATGLTAGAPYAGVLVALSGSFIVTTAPTTANKEDVTLTDGTTSFTMTDEAFANYTGAVPVLNECYSNITGVMDLVTSGSTQFRGINPRSAADLTVKHGGTVGAGTCNP